MQRYIINELGRTVYDDRRRMEAIVSASDLAWTIVPLELFEAPAASADGIAIDHIPSVHRPISEGLLLAPSARRHLCALDDRRRDASAKPSMLRLIWQDGVRNQA